MNKRGMALFLLAMVLCCTVKIYAKEEDVRKEVFLERVQEIKEIQLETTQKPEVTLSENRLDPKTIILQPEVIQESKGTLSENRLDPNTAQEQTEILYNVAFPTSTKAYLDPGNVSGEGQIFSEHYEIENYGNTDVSVKIKDISIQCLSEEDVYVFTEEEMIDPRSIIKKMHINMVWENENGQEKILHISEGVRDEKVLSLKAASYDDEGKFVSLMDGGTGSFYFTGTMNGNPGLQWENGEIVIRFHYEIIDENSGMY